MNLARIRPAGRRVLAVLLAMGMIVPLDHWGTHEAWPHAVVDGAIGAAAGLLGALVGGRWNARRELTKRQRYERWAARAR